MHNSFYANHEYLVQWKLAQVVLATQIIGKILAVTVRVVGGCSTHNAI